MCSPSTAHRKHETLFQFLHKLFLLLTCLCKLGKGNIHFLLHTWWHVFSSNAARHLQPLGTLSLPGSPILGWPACPRLRLPTALEVNISLAGRRICIFWESPLPPQGLLPTLLLSSFCPEPALCSVTSGLQSDVHREPRWAQEGGQRLGPHPSLQGRLWMQVLLPGLLRGTSLQDSLLQGPSACRC